MVLLAAFAVIEVRSTHALLPMRVLRSRDRTGAYLISLCVGTALFGMFFFLTIFVQDVWGYSPLKAGIAFLPMVATIMVASGIASQLVPRIGARPLMITGTTIMAGGMFWLSRISEHSSYAGGLLGPMLITALGLGLLFVPMALVSLTKVRNADTGMASSLVNVGQQVGGSIGLAHPRHRRLERGGEQPAVPDGGRRGRAAGHPLTAAMQKEIQHHALATGFSQGFLVSRGDRPAGADHRAGRDPRHP